MSRYGQLPSRVSADYKVEWIGMAAENQREACETYRKYGVDRSTPVFIAGVRRVDYKPGMSVSRPMSSDDPRIEPFPNELQLLVTDHPRIGGLYRLTLERIGDEMPE